MARLGNGDRNGGRNGARRGALDGPPPYKGSRYDPHGDGPTTPRDEQSRAHLRPDHAETPCGSPSDTPRPER